MLRRTCGVLVVLAMLATMLVGAPSAAAATCTVSGTTLTYALAAGDSETLRVSGNRVSMPGTNCAGNPGPTDVATILVNGSTGAETLTIDDAASFAPGVGAEPGSTTEIEFGIDLGAGTDQLLLTGSTGNDVYVAGSSSGAMGLDFNNDDDADITAINVELLGLDGLAGNDILSAQGDASTGTVLSLPLRIVGGLGNDSLVGGTRSDTFAQEPGSDIIRGGAGTDTASYIAAPAAVVVTVGLGANDGSAGERDDVKSDVEIVRGGAFNDVLTGLGGRNQFFGNGGNDRLGGGPGIDTLRGGAGNDTITGGTGADNLYGDAGADRFFALDRVRDRVVGGIGIDRSRHDAIDTRLSVEGRF